MKERDGRSGEYSYVDGARRALPVGIAVTIDGVAFGALASVVAIPPLAAVAMSALVFSGAAQFTAVAVIAAGGSAAAALVTAVLVTLRAVPMGLAASPALGQSLRGRLARAQLVTDESWALSQVEPGRWDRRLLVGAGVVMYGTWLGGTILGVVAADVLPAPETLGLDAAYPALFLVLLVGLVRTLGMAAAALAGAAVALALVPFTPPGIPILAASLVCLVRLARS